MVTNLFKKYGFNEIDEIKNKDVMNRDIEWVTQVYKLN